MDIPTAIEKLEAEWNFVDLTGFFGQLKVDVFDEEGFQRVKDILEAIELPEGEELDKRFVELTWFIPTYLHWRRPALVHAGKDTKKLDRAISFFEMHLTGILGLP